MNQPDSEPSACDDVENAVAADASADRAPRGAGSLRRRHRRRMQRIGVPTAFVVVIMAAVLLITWRNYVSNREAALALSADVLNHLDRRIATEVRTYMQPARDMVTLTANLSPVVDGQVTRREATEPLAIDVLRSHEQLAMFNIADRSGNFLMPKKMPDGAIDTKIIHRGGEAIDVSWVRRTPAGEVKRIERVPYDGYDPRVRPWYRGALERGGPYWTDVYIFFTDRTPGVTASAPVVDQYGDVVGVYGVDIELDELSSFLNSLKIGRRGEAIIVDEQGRLVAYPDVREMMRPDGEGGLRPASLDEVDDPVARRAYDRFRVHGLGRSDFTFEDERYLSLSSSLEGLVGRPWTVLTIVPEEDFIGFVGRNRSASLWMSLGVLAAAGAFAGLLVAQGLRADRNALLVVERQGELEAQSRAFASLSCDRGFFDATNEASLTRATREIATALNVSRVSFWRYEPAAKRLSCLDTFDASSGRHTSGVAFAEAEFPELFDALRGPQTLVVSDASRSPALANAYPRYFQPVGVRALVGAAAQCSSVTSVTSVKAGGLQSAAGDVGEASEGNGQGDRADSAAGSDDALLGLVLIEHVGRSRRWSADDRIFVEAVGGLLALRLSGDAGTVKAGSGEVASGERGAAEAARAADVSAASASVAPAASAASAAPLASPAGRGRTGTAEGFRPPMKRRGAWLADLPPTGPSGRDSSGAIQVFQQTTVLTLQFSDALMLARDGRSDRLNCLLQDLVKRLREFREGDGVGLEYVDAMGETIVCASGLGVAPASGARAAAGAALDILNWLSEFAGERDPTHSVRMGLDSGPALGASLSATVSPSASASGGRAGSDADSGSTPGSRPDAGSGAGVSSSSDAHSDADALASPSAVAVGGSGARSLAKAAESAKAAQAPTAGPSGHGATQTVFNLWGETVWTANTMARTGQPGEIHVSQDTYELIREAFVLQPRGLYFVADLGEIATYTLSGRL